MDELHEEGGGWFSWCKPEWRVIAGAPRAFVISVLALSILIGLGLYGFFKLNLELKTDLVSSLQSELVRVKGENDELHKKPLATEPSKQQKENVYDYPKSGSEWENYKLELVTQKSFRNEQLVIDGKHYYRCNFINVTFIYHGTAPARFSESRFHGHSLETDNRAIMDFVTLNRWFESLIPGGEVTEGVTDMNGNEKILRRYNAPREQPNLKR